MGARIAVDPRLASATGGSLRRRRHGRRGGAAPRRLPVAMERYGLRTSGRVVRGAFTEEGGRDGVTELLRSRRGVTAIFVSNDLAAVGALDALDEHGLRVPDDVSVVGTTTSRSPPSDPST